MLRTSHGHGPLEQLLVWDPVNGHEHPLAIPPGFGVKAQINGAEKEHMTGAVVRSVRILGHPHPGVIILAPELDCSTELDFYTMKQN